MGIYNPLTTALVWIILNKTGTITVTDTGIPYPVYAFTTLLWSIIVESINAPMTNTSGAKESSLKLTSQRSIARFRSI
jgi:lipopolysaccharide transport system permease protein